MTMRSNNDNNCGLSAMCPAPGGGKQDQRTNIDQATTPHKKSPPVTEGFDCCLGGSVWKQPPDVSKG